MTFLEYDTRVFRIHSSCTTHGGDWTSNNYHCQNFQPLFTGVPVHVKHIFSGVPKIWNRLSREWTESRHSKEWTAANLKPSKSGDPSFPILIRVSSMSGVRPSNAGGESEEFSIGPNHVSETFVFTGIHIRVFCNSCQEIVRDLRLASYARHGQSSLDTLWPRSVSLAGLTVCWALCIIVEHYASWLSIMHH